MKKFPYPEFLWPVFSHIRTEYGEIDISPYSVWRRKKTKQKNFEYRHFLRSVHHSAMGQLAVMHARKANGLFTKILTDNNPYINCFGRAVLENIDLSFQITSYIVNTLYRLTSVVHVFYLILMTLKVSGNLMWIELHYCEINQNLFFCLICLKCLNTENTKINIAKMKHCVTFNIQPKQKIEMIRGINQSLFLFLIQKCLNTKIAKLNATKLKKCGTFYKQCRQKTDMIRVTKVRFKSKVLHCQTKLVKISCNKKPCKIKARI